MYNAIRFWVIGWLLLGIVPVAMGDQSQQLRLVPFPKKIDLHNGVFLLNNKLIVEASDESGELLGKLINAELQRADLPAIEVRQLKTHNNVLRISETPAKEFSIPKFDDDVVGGSYVIQIRPDEIICTGIDGDGLRYAVATLCQLIRANRTKDQQLQCLTIHDWPSLTWRCFQDDLTRGPSSKLSTLKQHIDIGAALKMNLFTYYMEYQFAFKKHPLIGPENGSLTPEDLATLVKYATPRGIDILGNQQSFGHLTNVLKHEKYAPLRETGYIICPVKEESYQLLDDFYSEVCPILPFKMFNVCCDETWGLGTGPSKALADKIGVGGVYVGHIRRVHDLLKDKYDKRMMMWGDIILQHPDKLDQIPKDTVMLTWGYGAKDNFENQIIPFAKSEYEFFICPGINNWNRILPDFGTTTVNIHNFVRDGVKHGAVGMLNTAWEDDGEALQGYKWHGYAWGAECAWNASTTSPEDFNRRIGSVLFGECGDHFGQAIELLSRTHRLPGMSGMNNRRFWKNDFLPTQSEKSTRATAENQLTIVQPAIEHLEACREEATVNADLIDAFLFGARRMERIGLRMLDGLQAARLYTEAWEATDRAKRIEHLDEVARIVDGSRRAHAELGREFAQIWLAESKPFALDWTLDRYEKLDQWYADLASQLAKIRKSAEAGEEIPPPESLGLALPESFSRRTRPSKIIASSLAADQPWLEPSATCRVGIAIEAGSANRFRLPIELDLSLPETLASKPVHAFQLTDAGAVELLAQLDPTSKADKTRLTLIIPGPIAKKSTALVHVYLGLTHAVKSPDGSVTTTDAANGIVTIENDKVRLLLGRAGAHVFRWEVKSVDNRDLTLPGTADYSGFADAGRGTRNVPFKLTCTACGPALVRYVCKSETGITKTISLFSGASWMEVLLDEPTVYYWDFDNPANFSADGPTPGNYLFADGRTGKVGRLADGITAQVKAASVRWAIKYNDNRLALGMTTPELAANFVVAPGDNAGGVGIEASPPAAHFITFAGLLENEPAETMNRLQQTLDFKNQPVVILHAIEERE